MSTIVLVGCGSAKADESRPARELYTSNYFQLKREYAELVGDSWRVLSAEHGLLDPAQEASPYDRTIGDLDDELIDTWVMSVMGSLSALIDEHDELVEVEVLAGRDYVEPLRDRLDGADAAVRYPFDRTTGIGDQMGMLKDRIERGESA